MAATAWRKYESFPEFMGDNTIDMDGDTFKMALFSSTSNAATVTTNTAYTDLTNEVANGNGYTTGGVTLTSVTWAHSAGTTTFDCDNASWTASGGSIVARFAVIYSSTSGKLVCYCILDSTPADVTIVTGTTYTITIDATGVFTITGMTS
jgi:hypothetical protein